MNKHLLEITNLPQSMLFSLVKQKSMRLPQALELLLMLLMEKLLYALQDVVIVLLEYVQVVHQDMPLMLLQLFAKSVKLDVLSVAKLIPTHVVPAMMDTISQEQVASNVIQHA